MLRSSINVLVFDWQINHMKAHKHNSKRIPNYRQHPKIFGADRLRFACFLFIVMGYNMNHVRILELDAMVGRLSDASHDHERVMRMLWCECRRSTASFTLDHVDVLLSVAENNSAICSNIFTFLAAIQCINYFKGNRSVIDVPQYQQLQAVSRKHAKVNNVMRTYAVVHSFVPLSVIMRSQVKQAVASLGRRSQKSSVVRNIRRFAGLSLQRIGLGWPAVRFIASA